MKRALKPLILLLSFIDGVTASVARPHRLRNRTLDRLGTTGAPPPPPPSPAPLGGIRRVPRRLHPPESVRFICHLGRHLVQRGYHSTTDYHS